MLQGNVQICVNIKAKFLPNNTKMMNLTLEISLYTSKNNACLVPYHKKTTKIFVCVYIHTNTHIYVHTYTCAWVHMCVVYTYMHVCACVCMWVVCKTKEAPFCDLVVVQLWEYYLFWSQFPHIKYEELFKRLNELTWNKILYTMINSNTFLTIK